MDEQAPHMRRTIAVLYEDDCCIAFNKPAGLLTIPTPKNEPRTLIALANEQNAAASCRLHPCHRLDRDTSGVILFAKGKKNQKRLMDQFKRGTVIKKYVALAHGRIHPPQGTIVRPVAPFDRQKFRRNARPQHAVTHYTVLKQKTGYCIVAVFPKTGRTNQIRIHFKDIGHPLVGERKYAFARDFKLTFKRTALHASELRWQHPVNRRTTGTCAPLPQDMENFIRTH